MIWLETDNWAAIATWMAEKGLSETLTGWQRSDGKARAEVEECQGQFKTILHTG